MKKLKFERFYHQNILCFLGMTVLFCMLLFPACIKPSDGGSTTTPPKVNEWDTLPAITQIGANTMGCLLNDTVWVPHGFTLMGALQSANVDEDDYRGNGSLQFRIAGFGKNETFNIGFGATFFEQKVFQSGLFSSLGDNYFRPIFNGQDGEYQIDTQAFNENDYLQVTYIDTSANILSGNFSFTLYKVVDGTEIDKTDSITITDGHFDMTYIPN